MSESCCWHYNGFPFCLFFPGPKRWCWWAICLGQQRVLEETLHRKGAFSILFHLPLAKLKFLPLNKDVRSFFLQEVAFKVDYTVPSIGREFGSVFIGDKNVALLVVSEGWAKVMSLFFINTYCKDCDLWFSVWALAESCPAGQRAGSTERRSESFPSRTATSGRASQATRSGSLEHGSHFTSFSPLL